METKVCRDCGRELPIESFRKGKASGTEFRMTICTDCWRKRQHAGKMEKKEKLALQQDSILQDAKNRRLADFTPRELMLELKRRGYEGELTYTEVHKIDISSLT